MKILHCIPSMQGGGAERQLTYLAAESRRQGDEVHVAITSRGVNFDRLVAAGAVVHELHGRTPHDPRLVLQLRRLIGRLDPAVVQSWLLQMDVVAGVAALSRRTPLILTERSSAEAYPWSLKRTLRTTIGRMAGAIVANSEQGRQYWASQLGSRIPLRVIPNVVPTGEIERMPPAAELPLPQREHLALFVGRFEKEKNLGVLLEGLTLALATVDFNVAFCGTGTMQSLVHGWIDAHAFHDRAIVLGYTSTVWGLMKRASVIISPALFEGTPNVVLEAMAARCPLIVSDIPAHRALLDETSASLIDPRSAPGLAAAVRDVLMSPERARMRAQVAYERTSAFTPEVIAAAYRELYREVARTRGQHSH